MPPDHPSKGGRPRGSGGISVRVVLHLSQDQALPVLAGQRIGLADPSFMAAWQGDAAAVSPRLTARERAAMSRRGDEWFCSWVRIGLQAADLEHEVTIKLET